LGHYFSYRRSESTMPPELWLEVQAAARRAEELRAADRELRFRLDHGCRRVVVEVCDLEGRLIRTASPVEVVEVASGAPLS
jgi:hypothetical protein